MGRSEVESHEGISVLIRREKEPELTLGHVRTLEKARKQPLPGTSGVPAATCGRLATCMQQATISDLPIASAPYKMYVCGAVVVAQW